MHCQLIEPILKCPETQYRPPPRNEHCQGIPSLPSDTAALLLALGPL